MGYSGFLSSRESWNLSDANPMVAMMASPSQRSRSSTIPGRRNEAVAVAALASRTAALIETLKSGQVSEDDREELRVAAQALREWAATTWDPDRTVRRVQGLVGASIAMEALQELKGQVDAEQMAQLLHNYADSIERLDAESEDAVAESLIEYLRKLAAAARRTAGHSGEVSTLDSFDR